MKRFLPFLALAAILYAPHVLAQGFVPIAPIPNLTDQQTANAIISTGSLASFLNSLYRYLIGLAATLALVEIVWAGFQWSTSSDNAAKIQAAKERIGQAVLGLVLVLSPVLVFSIINPAILNLSVNLPPINLSTSQPVTTPTQTTTAPTYTTSPGTKVYSTPQAGQWCFSYISTPGTPASYSCNADVAACTKDIAAMTASGTSNRITSACTQQ